MTSEELAEVQKQWQGSLKSYVIGFSASILLTLLAYLTIELHLFSVVGAITTIVILGLVQMVVQLIYFLHLGKETRPRWNQLIFGIMLTLLCIIVVGSLWIMFSLDERVMPAM